jgi:O-glycosyl hydrolase
MGSSSRRIEHFYVIVFSILLTCISANVLANADTTFCTYQVILDDQGKILPWYSPGGKAYDHFLKLRWNFIKTRVPLSPGPSPRSFYPQYYFYCAFKDRDGVPEPDAWMNDIGEKIPNWFESARLYYAYTGDSSVMTLVRNLVDYTLIHGNSPSGFAWPGFPYTTTNAGDTLFRGFTNSGRFARHEIQVDHAGEIGLTYFRMYQYTLDGKYLNAAIRIADVLARYAIDGNARQSVWPYRVIMDKGKITAAYGANWTGCYQLLDDLIRNNYGNVDAYKTARDKAGKFLLQYPMKTGYWTDGHSDNNVNSSTYKSNLSASNATLFLFDHPGFDPEWKTHIPMLITWTEDNFIARCAPGEPASMWGANIVGEQDGFLYKMDYQTARYAAACARWYAISGDKSYKEKAYRSLNWVTYCNDTSGMAFESPVSKGILSWWSDCYGECPRMFYQAFAGIPEWAPPRENHILYSAEVLRNIRYGDNLVAYSSASPDGIEYLRLAFKPKEVALNGNVIPFSTDSCQGFWTIRDLGNGDYAVEITRKVKGDVVVSGSGKTLLIDITSHLQQMAGIGVNANTRSWNGNELKSAIDLLADSMNFKLWRVIAETVEKWEVENDNDDPFSLNWDYYNQLYETPKFRKVWDMMEYLNGKGIKEKLMLNLMGRLPAWMGDSIILPDKEDEYVEMLVSFICYAKNNRHLQFGLFGPMNEPDIQKEGPTVGPAQYAAVIRKLVDRMNSLGLADIKIVVPDVAGMNNGIKEYLPLLFADPVIMASMAYAGLHSYAGYYAPASDFLKRSSYPTTSLWMTECNAWRNGLDNGVKGIYDFNFARECVTHIIDLIKNGANACLLWEGYDSYYEHHAPSPFSYWGILGFDPGSGTYYPRKHFYGISQVSKFIPQDSWQIALQDNLKMPLAAFFDQVSGRVTLVGINKKPVPELLSVGFKNAVGLTSMEMFITGEANNFRKMPDVNVRGGALSIIIPPDCIFTLAGIIPDEDLKALLTRPEPQGWYSGDMHVHRNCGEITSILSERELTAMMKPNDLSVIALLADMGNGEVKDSNTDLPRVDGNDAKESESGRIVHWDAEWHFDPAGVTFENKALGGHLVFLGLKEAHTIWNESPFKIIEWGKKQNAVIGFCHMEYLNDKIPDKLDCCTPLDFPVEAALGTIDFLAEDVWVNDAALNAYYRLLNCGFRLGWTAGTDYPCNESQPFGSFLTWVNLKDQPLTYRNWIDGISNGRTVVSANGNSEFIDLKVNKTFTPGDEIKLLSKDSIDVEVTWTAAKELTGWIELVLNGNIVEKLEGTASPTAPMRFKARIAITRSTWICARRMNEEGHQSHTAPVYISMGNAPVRASADDAQFFIDWIDNLLNKIKPGGQWNSYVSGNQKSIARRYLKARKIYTRIAHEAENNNPD